MNSEFGPLSEEVPVSEARDEQADSQEAAAEPEKQERYDAANAGKMVFDAAYELGIGHSDEMAAILQRLEAGEPFSPEMYGQFQDLAGAEAEKFIEHEAGTKARFGVGLAEVGFLLKAGELDGARERLTELEDYVHQAGPKYLDIEQRIESLRSNL